MNIISLIAPLVFYRAATQWDLPPYRITIWLIDDVMLIFVCLPVGLIQGFCYGDLREQNLVTGGLELVSTITLKLQANRRTRCASQSSNVFNVAYQYRTWIVFLTWNYMIAQNKRAVERISK